ncbi:hypothetical protein JW933_09175 [candidate division FCPU426 bacterium]|nr:hypothetical protein [candidate division FCPU426 bacterium]
MERSRETRKEILLVPIGKVLVDILGEVAVALRKMYKYHVHIGRSEEPDTSMYSDERRQYDAERLLELASARKRESLVAILGIVDADMFAGEKNFIFGLTKPEKSISVIALARLREEYYKKPSKLELFLRRAVKEAVFQVGLALGLPACATKSCIMLPTTTLWRLDEKNQTFCTFCQTRMEKMMLMPPAAEKKKAFASQAAEIENGEVEGAKQEMVLNGTWPKEQTGKQPEDESEIAAALVQPEEAMSAEEAAMHTAAEGLEEPLSGNMPDEEK